MGLLDCNNFFVSCERLFRPDLKTKPVLVLSSNDGCVVARSEEVKDSGIPMGVPYFKVKDIIKDIDATTFSSHFALYRDISRRVFEVMRTELAIVEQYSVDEAFFLINGSADEVQKRAHILKDKVEQLIGIPVSIGIARSKTQAKIANGIAKKTTGIFVMTAQEWESRMPGIKLTDLWGVGYRLGEQYRKAGINTIPALLRLEERQVKALFGVVGVRLWLELQGKQSNSFSREHGPQKSILHSRSFKHTSTDLSVLKDAVAYHVREAAEDLRSQKQKTRYLQVSLLPSRHSDFLLQGGSAGVEFTDATSDTFVLLKEAMRLVEHIYRPEVPYKKAGITLSGFIPETVRQSTLFSKKKTEETAALMPIIDAINQQKGRGSLVLGSRLKTSLWQASKELKSPSYTTCWQELKTVKA